MTQREAIDSGLFWYVTYDGTVRTDENQLDAERGAFAECSAAIATGPTSCSITVFKGITPVAQVRLSNGDGWHVWSPANYEVEIDLTPEEVAHIIQRRIKTKESL